MAATYLSVWCSWNYFVVKILSSVVILNSVTCILSFSSRIGRECDVEGRGASRVGF